MTAVASDRFEAVIDLWSATVDPWGFRVTSPQWPMPSALLFLPDEVGDALVSPVSLVSAGRLQTLSVSRSGMARVVDECSGEVFFYELFPARWSDGEGPAVYVGVWPD